MRRWSCRRGKSISRSSNRSFSAQHPSLIVWGLFFRPSQGVELRTESCRTRILSTACDQPQSRYRAVITIRMCSRKMPYASPFFSFEAAHGHFQLVCLSVFASSQGVFFSTGTLGALGPSPMAAKVQFEKLSLIGTVAKKSGEPKVAARLVARLVHPPELRGRGIEGTICLPLSGSDPCLLHGKPRQHLRRS